MAKIVGFIPIKLNNQRLPGKNTMDLGGKPLCKYVFETVSDIRNIDETYVVCSDDRIKSLIPAELRFLKRPRELDTDTVKSKDIIRWFLSQVNADIYVLMHVTQPFITRETIETSIDKVLSGEYDSAFPAKTIQEFAWYEGKPINYSFDNVVRTQDLKPIYIETELFAFRKAVFTVYGRRIGFKPYIHPISWVEGITIDDASDFEQARLVVGMGKRTF